MNRRLFRVLAVALGAALLAAAPKTSPKPAWPAGDPGAVIKHVLAEPAYRADETTGVAAKETPLEFVLHWLRDRVGSALGAFFRALRGAQTAGAAFGIGLIIALLSLLVLLIARIVTFFAYGRGRSGGAALETAAAIVERPASEWFALARAAAARGDYAAAIAGLFNAALRLLDERDIVPFDGSRSPGEYRVLVRRAYAPAAGAFEIVSRRFVVASFSPAPSGPAEYEDALAAYGALEEGTP